MANEQESTFDFFNPTKILKTKSFADKLSDVLGGVFLCICVLGIIFASFGITINLARDTAKMQVINYAHITPLANSLSDKYLNAFTSYLQHPEMDKYNHFYYDNQKINQLSQNIMSSNPTISVLANFFNLIANSSISSQIKEKTALSIMKYVRDIHHQLKDSISQQLLERQKNYFNVINDDDYVFTFQKEMVNQYGYLWLSSKELREGASLTLSEQRQHFLDEATKFNAHKTSKFDSLFL